MRNRNISVLLLFFMVLAQSAYARKAQGGTQLLSQPDGSTFMATLRGDEFCHLMLTAGGNAVVQDEDGWFSYALFDSEGRISSSGVHVGMLSADPEVVHASCAIPFSMLGANASRTRSMIPDEEMNLLRRLNALNYPDGAVKTKASSGVTKHGIVLLVNFSDVSFRKNRSDFVAMLTAPGYSENGAVGSAKEYFDDQFGGMYEFDFDVVGPVTVSQKRSYYGGNDSDGQDKNPEQMIVEACRLVDPDVDFSLYDDDGDGQIDNVFVFFAGGDEAEYAGDDCIWSHAWYIKDGARLDVSLDGKVLNRYACTSELTTFDHGKTFSMAPIGTFCHEYSHTLGLSDLYDTDYEKSGGTSEALWHTLSLMDGGNMNGMGNIPPYYSAIEREILGIGECLPLTEGRVVLEPIDVGNIYYKVESETVDDEFFLIECRRQHGWDAALGGEGVLVYHIDRSRNKTGLSSATNRTLTAMQRWAYNEVNANPAHQCADLIEADPGARDPASSSVRQVFFPYSRYNSLVPGDGALRFWNGTDAPLSITNLRLSDGTALFNVLENVSTEVPPTVENIVTDIFQDAAVISFESSRVSDAEAHISWGESGKLAHELVLPSYEDGKYSLVLEGLSSSSSYKVTICFETSGGIAGVGKTVSFLTASSSSASYPFIYLKTVSRNSDGSFPSGCRLPLRIYNAGSAVDGIFWYFNDSPITIGADGYWRVSGDGLLKAEIMRRDGTKDIVAKQINVSRE